MSTFERWMVQSNLDRIAAGANPSHVVLQLWANGYSRVATAVARAVQS